MTAVEVQIPTLSCLLIGREPTSQPSKKTESPAGSTSLAIRDREQHSSHAKDDGVDGDRQYQKPP